MVRRAATLRDIDRMLGPPLELDRPSMRKSRLSVRLARRLDTLVQDFGAEVQITQDELAGLVGVTRESINRRLQE
jgi:CRP-like cAMP-binding protein